MKRLFLIGYMGAGKTTLGRELAKVMNLEFIDLDHYIQARYLKTVNQIFEEKGEAGFRQIERSLLHEICEIEDAIISTGGGTPCFFDNMEYMNSKGRTVYLKGTPEALAKRLNTSKEKRPLIRGKNEEELYEFIKESLDKRDPFYLQAQIVFDTSELITRDEVGKFVERLIEKLG